MTNEIQEVEECVLINTLTETLLPKVLPALLSSNIYNHLSEDEIIDKAISICEKTREKLFNKTK